MLLHAAALFGQMNRQPGRKGPSPETLIAILINSGLLLLIATIVSLIFLQTLSRCLAQCSPRNRTMKPGHVWLNLIPFFGMVWMFITIIRISDSLKNEFRDRKLRSDDPQFGKMTGILFLVLSYFCGPIGFIFWIMYWVKIARYKKQLKKSTTGGNVAEDQEERPRRGGKGRDDEEDDRPRRRGGRQTDDEED